MGNDRSLIGWFRDAGCVPPKYTLKSVITRSGKTITISLPDFHDDIALKAFAQ
ncbi:MAG: hypothetical protein GXY67_02325 [Clostridiales bacterium]|nr:hypothetical protein [Clostridiales bacterium]